MLQNAQSIKGQSNRDKEIDLFLWILPIDAINITFGWCKRNLVFGKIYSSIAVKFAIVNCMCPLRNDCFFIDLLCGMDWNMTASNERLHGIFGTYNTVSKLLCILDNVVTSIVKRILTNETL